MSVKGGGTGLTVEPDGSTVLIAGAEFDKAGATVTKFAADGTPDQSFGEKGTATLPLPAESSLELVAPVPGGGYLIAGEEAPAKGCDPCESTPFLERLTAAGRPDPGYGKDGVAVAHLPLGRLPWPATQRALVVSPDGSAVVAGSNYGQDAYLGGWTAAGAPNASFGEGGGLTEHHEQPAQLEPTGLALTRGGGLTVVSQRSSAPGLITGFKVDFDAAGKQLPAPNGAAAVETLAHGAIASLGGGGVAIWTGNENRPARGLESAGANGLPLKGFGRRGTVKFPQGFVAEQITSAPGGGVLAVGGVKGKKTMAVLRLGPGGHPVHGFGRDGLAEVSFPGGSAVAVAGLVEADGDTTVTGTAGGSVVAARLLPRGRLDKHFGHGGRALGLLGGAVGTLIAPWHGGVVIAAASGRLAKGLIRLDADGRLVRGFGRRGVVRKGAEKAPLAVLSGAGRIVVVTNPLYEHGHKGNGVELRSYKPDGSVDRAFGHHGVRFYGSGREGRNGWRSFVPVAAVEQPGGKVVVAGTAYGETWLSETDWIERSKAELVRFLVR